MAPEEVHEEISYGMEGRHPRVRRTIVLIAAVVILLAATSTALALIKPEIFYHIKEKITNWRITFQTSEEADAPVFAYIEPEVPEGYEIVDEAKGNSYYYITYRNDQGDTIGYSQMIPEDATISIDSEQAKPHEETHGGHGYIVYERTEASTVIFDNGDYVFALDGNCDKRLLFRIAEKLIL